MAITKLTDIIEPAVYLRYEREFLPEKLDLLSSAAFVAPPGEVAGQMAQGGSIIDVPFWQDIDRNEPDIPTDNEATISTPAKVTATKFRVQKLFWVRSWSSMRLAGIIATGNGGDPLKNIADFTINYWRRQVQKATIKVMDGVLADNVANDSSDLLYSIYSDIATPLAANKISFAAINRARYKFGEFMNDNVTTIVVHSKVYADMLDQEAITFIRPSQYPFEIATFGGMQVVISDDCTTVSGTNSPKYRSYLLGAGAVGYMTYYPDDAIETWKNPLAGNGNGQDYLINRRQVFIAPHGWSYIKGSQSGKGPTYAELATAGNWDRVMQKNNCRIAYLESN